MSISELPQLNLVYACAELAFNCAENHEGCQESLAAAAGKSCCHLGTVFKVLSHTFLPLTVSGPVTSGAVMLLQSAVSVLEIGTTIASFTFQTAHFPETKALRL